MNWDEVAHLQELDGERIQTSLVGSDYFIVANSEWHFYMYDMVGFRILDKGFIKDYPVTCMMQITENMVVFGHQRGIITLWDTSKRYLTPEEIEKMRK